MSNQLEDLGAVVAVVKMHSGKATKAGRILYHFLLLMKEKKRTRTKQARRDDAFGTDGA